MKWRRKDLRRSQTIAEGILWQQLRKNNTGFRFKRQYSIMNYVVDFFSSKAKLAIELDGDIHRILSSLKYDQYRTKYLESLGIKEIRFSNNRVLNDVSSVLIEIRKRLPSPEVRRGNEGEVK